MQKAEIQPGVWREWTIESVELRHPKDRSFDDPTGIPPDAIVCWVRGRTTDGLAFVNRMLITQAFFDDLGETKVIEMLRKWARPPE